MSSVAEVVVETLELRLVDGSAHAAFLGAVSEARTLWLAARGARNVDVTRGSSDALEYRVRVEWRSEADRAAFAASEAAPRVATALASFPERARRLEVRIADAELARAGSVSIEPAVLRAAFGHYPSGVAIVTAMGPGGPAGMVVSSFTSVSLKPPLVSFYAAHTSTTWPIIADVRTCCVNVLASDQGGVCQTIASKTGPRFDAVPWKPAPSGAPIFDGVASWLDCRIAEVRGAGDHDLVLLEVTAHAANADLQPLVFHRSGYRTLAGP